MDLSRRKFLLSSATSMLLLSGPLPVRALPVNRAMQISVLTTDQLFADLLQTRLPNLNPVSLTGQINSPKQMKVLRNWLKKSAGQRLLGAVGSDFYPILESMVRDAGGAGLFHGRHTVTNKDWSRHQFYTVHESQGAAQYLMNNLGAGHRVCRVNETCLGAERRYQNTRSPAKSIADVSDWKSVVIEMMVNIARDTWNPGTVSQYPLAMGDESLGAITSLETFVFRV